MIGQRCYKKRIEYYVRSSSFKAFYYHCSSSFLFYFILFLIRFHCPSIYFLFLNYLLQLFIHYSSIYELHFHSYLVYLLFSLPFIHSSIKKPSTQTKSLKIASLLTTFSSSFFYPPSIIVICATIHSINQQPHSINQY